MNGKCNQISLNESALMAELKKEAQLSLTMEGNRLMNHMRREIGHTTYGGAPGKPAWRAELAGNLRNTDVQVTDDAVSMSFGYEPAGKAALVRAMIVEAGSGSEVGNAPVHAGPAGRNVWDGDVQQKHPSKAKSEYNLPEAFNQKGNAFVENAVRLMQTEFGQLTELTFATTPDHVYYGHVEVSKP